MLFSYVHSLIGSALIGLASALYFVLDGRIAGISGIISGALKPPHEDRLRNAAFLFGLFLGPILYRMSAGGWPSAHYGGRLSLLALAGALVGFGTRLGSGCTSGHGVCGLARRSPRSMAAVAVFLAAGVVTVAAMNRLGL